MKQWYLKNIHKKKKQFCTGGTWSVIISLEEFVWNWKRPTVISKGGWTIDIWFMFDCFCLDYAKCFVTLRHASKTFNTDFFFIDPWYLCNWPRSNPFQFFRRWRKKIFWLLVIKSHQSYIVKRYSFITIDLFIFIIMLTF